MLSLAGEERAHAPGEGRRESTRTATGGMAGARPWLTRSRTQKFAESVWVSAVQFALFMHFSVKRQSLGDGMIPAKARE